MSTNCYKCRADLQFEANQSVVRSEACPKCLTSIRCCSMCSFYDKKSYNECREPSADRTVDKEKANFCDFFKINTGQDLQAEKNNALDKANALFK